MHYSSMQKQAANNHQPITRTAPPTPILLEIAFIKYNRHLANYIVPYTVVLFKFATLLCVIRSGYNL